MSASVRAVPGSPSLVIRSAHIVLLRIVAIDAGPWRPQPRRIESRVLALDAVFEEALKGRIDAVRGTQVHVVAEQ